MKNKADITLSQCMIVKNEERNIEKALSWGKGIVCEQIVVDTGSTDRTVEIAESMGAKVCHFEWIKDFAAAKNYAIEQASGTWIAFLDADEYVTEEEVGNIIPLLEMINDDPKMRKQYLVINCPWIQLNDEGQPKEILVQERIFRNLPYVRYVGKIHEKLNLKPKDVVHTKDFRIMHTGYTGESFLVTGKSSRNTDILRAELREKPNDLDLKGYLAVSLKSQIAIDMHNAGGKEGESADPKMIAEMESLFAEVLDNIDKVIPLLQQSTYDFYLEKYVNAAQSDPLMDKICQNAYKRFPNEHRFMCYYAMMLNKKREYKEAFEILRKCEESLEASAGSGSLLTTQVMGLLLAQMVLAAQGMGDIDTALKYAEIMLVIDKTNMGVLCPYIATLVSRHNSLDEVYAVLAHTYDMSSKRDLLTIARAAKNCGAIELAKRIVDVVAYLGDNS